MFIAIDVLCKYEVTFVCLQSEVKKTTLTVNVDAPEGVLDAVMQSVVCQNRIGWREDARHLLIVSTDASFHYAGDGKVCMAVTYQMFPLLLNVFGIKILIFDNYKGWMKSNGNSLIFLTWLYYGRLAR